MNLKYHLYFFILLRLFFNTIQAEEIEKNEEIIHNQTNNSAINLTSLNEFDDANLKPDDIPFESLQTFVDVFDVVKRRFVEETDNRHLIEGAIRGMLTRLDPYSNFLSDAEHNHFEAEAEGIYAGIGLVLDIKNSTVTVISALDNSPAQLAGIKSGDLITHIDEKDIQHLNIDEINKLLNGNIGSQVKITLLQENKVQNLTLTREIIKTSGLFSQIKNNQFAYIRINQFQENTADDLLKELQALQVKHQLEGAIIDLRNNPGGILESAIASADLFLDSGIIVSIKERDGKKQDFSAEKGDIFANKLLLVLINNSTASAAEIFTAALKDNQRAIVVGRNSFGKGSVQSVIPLYHGGAVKLTTAYYLSPKGEQIHNIGIAPQVILKNKAENNQENNKDYELEEALNILSALYTANKNKDNQEKIENSKENQE
ncbi:MAG: S41 family peptidase [Cardiobacteriaceae bacterium]|nr:S41 family peptidase [Cardiobacteriaceae bacterium]